mgnify:CR=1 FL=1
MHLILDFVGGEQLLADGGVEEDTDDEDGQTNNGVLEEAKDIPISSSALWAIRLPGAPMRERLPPIAAAKTRGISSLERE